MIYQQNLGIKTYLRRRPYHMVFFVIFIHITANDITNELIPLIVGVIYLIRTILYTHPVVGGFIRIRVLLEDQMCIFGGDEEACDYIVQCPYDCSRYEHCWKSCISSSLDNIQPEEK